jgi:S1-C subfamily serine protease
MDNVPGAGVADHERMVPLRSFVFAMAGACFALALAYPRPVRVEREVVQVAAPCQPTATIVDVAPGVPATQLGALVYLAPGEHVAAVDDHHVAGDLDAGAALAQAHAPGYIDLTVEGGGGSRRVLVLLH